MTITATKLTDNNFNIIVKANGVGSEEEQTLVDVENSNNATSEPKVSIADTTLAQAGVPAVAVITVSSKYLVILYIWRLPV